MRSLKVELFTIPLVVDISTAEFSSALLFFDHYPFVFWILSEPEHRCLNSLQILQET